MPTELPAPELAAFTREQVRFAAEAWPLRAAEELRSARIYHALAAAAPAALPPPWPGRFSAVAREELGHARLCVRVGARLGARTPDYDAAPVRARLAALPDPAARAAALVLVEVAIGETISMILFRAGLRTTSEPLTRAALVAILADEVRHQRLGWDALAQLVPAHRARLERDAAAAFVALEARIAAPALRQLEAGAAFDPAWGALGVLPFERRVEAFYFAIERLVVPRLQRLGLDGARAWRDRYRG